MRTIQTVDQLEDDLSAPTPGVLETLRSLEGDVLVLGAGGKVGPTLSRMIRRGLNELGQKDRRVIAVSRFGSGTVSSELNRHGVETISCDLLDRQALEKLPDAPNVIFMAGQKFGTVDAPEQTWAMNALVPAYAAERYAESRIVVFSTGCVYPLVPVGGPGAREEDLLGPPGEYANSCVGRERIFTYFSKKNGTRVVLFRLCYAIDLRYGVLCDVAMKVANGLHVDVSMGWANVIWQRDANARAIQCLALATSPPMALNVTGIERVSIRQLAMRFGELFGREPMIAGQEANHAWVWDASRCLELFGPPSVSIDEMIVATAAWLKQGGETLGKPTHFEVADGNY